MKHLKYILILALSSAMGTLQAQDLKELMKENRENREANYAKWGPTSDHNGRGYVFSVPWSICASQQATCLSGRSTWLTL